MNAIVRRCAEVAVAAGLGILGGLSVSWLRPSSRGGPRYESPEPTPLPEPPPSEPGGEAIAALSPAEFAPRAAPASSAPSARDSTPQAANPVEFEDELREADRFHEQQHEAALRRHRNEPKDPRWASATEAKLEAELEGVAAASKFKVVRVDCRTTMCLGVLEWRSYPEAMRGYGVTLRRAYQVNCAQAVLLLPPTNPAAAYQASMIFDCESWRAAGN